MMRTHFPHRFWAMSLMLAGCLLPAVGCASSQVRTETMEYRDGQVTLKGTMAYDANASGKRPGVLVLHEWWGVNDYSRRRARQLAELGYVALAADMFGEGKSTQDVKDAQAWAGQLYGTPLMAQRARAGLEALRGHPNVDPDRIVAIGYCFGGTAAVELAYSGAPIRGAVSFHGNPVAPTAEQAAATQARLLILIGARDPMFDTDTAKALTDGLNVTDLDWEMISYSQAVHSFTSPEADSRGMQGVAYNVKADKRSWQQLQTFLKQVFEDR